mgnify:CR=1 FL=1
MGIIDDAGNIKNGTNPPYTLEDFYLIYPQFGAATDLSYIVPQIIAQMYLDMADACVKEIRWHNLWKVGMALFIAHFCTLYVRSIADPDSGATGILKAGQLVGLETSVSVGDVSVSTDYSLLVANINGWVQWKSTTFGIQFAGMGKLLGKGGMYIW